ncbi:MAG: glycosyl hydrolase family 28-related protein [Myxococcota bacterium]
MTDPVSETQPPPTRTEETGAVDSADATGTNEEPVDSAPPEDSGEPGDTSEPIDPNRWRSALYPEDWTPGFTVDGRFLHDFSYAGYHYGEADPPASPPGAVFDVTHYGADQTGASDSTSAIQAAIDDASQRGGVVWLPAGEYRCDGLLSITASGVVLRGEGMERTRLFFTRSDQMTDRHHIMFSGHRSFGERRPLAADGESRADTIRLEDTHGLSVGDEVEIGWVITEDFVAEHQMQGTWQAFNGTWRPIFRRTIRAIDADTVTLDVPLRYPAQIRDQASLRTVSGMLEEVGVQELAVSTVVDWDAAWTNDRSHAITLSGVKNGWVWRVRSYASPNVRDDRDDHLQSGGVMVVHSRLVTVAEVTMEQAQNRGGGGNGYLFEISRSGEVLIQDAVGRAGRHNFIQNWDFGTSGCVFLRTLSEDGVALQGKDWEWLEITGYSEFHHSLAMANLIDDSVAADGWKAVNRGDYSSGAGHAATQSVFWNLQGDGAITSLQFGDGYVIGTEGLNVTTAVWDIFESAGTAPEDFVEGIDEGRHLDPPSLYEDQRKRRLARGERRSDSK